MFAIIIIIVTSDLTRLVIKMAEGDLAIVEGEVDEPEDDAAECIEDFQGDFNVDLSKVAQDYAQYLVVDSKRDVSVCL